MFILPATVLRGRSTVFRISYLKITHGMYIAFISVFYEQRIIPVKNDDHTLTRRLIPRDF